MAAVYRGSAFGKGAAGTVISFSYTSGSGSDRYLAARLHSPAGRTLSAIKFNAVDLTTQVGGGSSVLADLVAPVAGAATFTVTLSSYSSSSVQYAIADFEGVDQTTPRNSTTSNTATSTTPTTGSITVPADSVLFAGSNHGFSTPPPTIGSGTSIGTRADSGNGFMASYRTTTGTLDWTCSNSSSWSMYGVVVSPVAASGIPHKLNKISQAIQRSQW